MTALKYFRRFFSISLFVSTGLLLCANSSLADTSSPSQAIVNKCSAQGYAQLKLTNNVIVNGSFESPQIHGWSVFRRIKGWRTVSGPGIEIQADKVAGTPFHGLQHAELDSDANSVIEQMVLTQPLNDYCLVFAYSPRPDVGLESEGLRVWVNKKAVHEIKRSGLDLSDTHWEVVFVRIKTTASRKPTSLRFEPLGKSDSMGVYLDGVEMYAIRD